jgi:hypothetical protein
MKIISINRVDSDDHNLALNTEPMLQPAIFEHFRILAANDPALRNFTPSLSVRASLVLHSAASIDSAISAGFVQIVERVLTSAEVLFVKDIGAKRKEADLQYKHKIAVIEVAAKKLGIPIQ